MKKIRSRHNDLLNYFMYDNKYLSKEYVKKSKKYLTNLKKYDIPEDRNARKDI